MEQQCVDHSKDPAGCQPSTFDTPLAQMPSVRVNRQGQIDPTSSEADAKAGAFELEKRLHLFRNFEHLHWVCTVPSVRDAATGAWKGGDLDGAGDGRGLGVAGNLSVRGARQRRRRQTRDQHLQDSTEPREAAAGAGRGDSGDVGRQPGLRRPRAAIAGLQDIERRDRYVLVRNAGTNTLGRMQAYQIDMNTCLPTFTSEVTDFHSQSHEFFLWHDPANANRVLVYMTNWTGGLPDPSIQASRCLI
jgi:hypothetical protein